MKIAFLHIGKLSDSGVTQYGSYLEKELASNLHLKGKVDAVSRSLIFDFLDRKEDLSALRRALHELESAEILHLQISDSTNRKQWGPCWLRSEYIKYVFDHWQGKVIVTFHDFREVPKTNTLYHLIKLFPTAIRRVVLLAGINLGKSLRSRTLIRLTEAAERHFSFRQIELLASETVNFYEFESTLAKVKPARQLTSIPHFSKRAFQRGCLTRTQSRRAETQPYKILLLGYIFERKGFHLAIEALAHLNLEFELELCGSPTPNSNAYIQKILRRSEELGFQRQPKITGFLSEDEQIKRLDQANLVICPFHEIYSASGTLSVILSTTCPIIVSDISLVNHLNQKYPELIPSTKVNDAKIFAQAIESALLNPDRHVNAEARQKYCTDNAIGKIATRYFQRYQRLVEI